MSKIISVNKLLIKFNTSVTSVTDLFNIPSLSPNAKIVLLQSGDNLINLDEMGLIELENHLLKVAKEIERKKLIFEFITVVNKLNEADIDYSTINPYPLSE